MTRNQTWQGDRASLEQWFQSSVFNNQWRGWQCSSQPFDKRPTWLGEQWALIPSSNTSVSHPVTLYQPANLLNVLPSSYCSDNLAVNLEERDFYDTPGQRLNWLTDWKGINWVTTVGLTFKASHCVVCGEPPSFKLASKLFTPIRQKKLLLAIITELCVVSTLISTRLFKHRNSEMHHINNNAGENK